MACVAVFEFPGYRIELCQKKTRKRRHRRHSAEVAVYTPYDCLRLGVPCSVRTNQSHQMTDPHPRGETFAADVSQSKDDTIVNLLGGDKVTQHVANSENFAGNFKVAMPDQTRGA